MNVLFLFESVLPVGFSLSTMSPGELRVIAAQARVGHVFALGPQGTSFYDVKGSVLKTFVERKISLIHFWWPRGFIFYYLTWIGLVCHGWNMCKHGHIGVIHAESPHISGIAARILGSVFHIPVITEYRVSYDQLLIARYGRFFGQLWRRLFWTVALPILRRSSAVAANSKTYVSLLKNRYHLSSVYFYNPGVRLPRDYSPIVHRGIRIGYLGRLYPDKGPEYVIALASRYRRWWEDHGVHFVIGGDGPLLKTLQRTVRVRGLTHLVSFYGSIDRWKFLQYCDVLVNTTVVHPALEMVIAEAACAGIPCIAFGEDGYPETVLNGTTGIIVPTGNIKAMGTALKNMVMNKTLREEMGKASMIHGKEYRFETQTMHVKEMYRTLAVAA